MRRTPRGTSEQWLGWLSGPDDKLRKKATLILGGLDPSDKVAIEPLIDALHSDDGDIVFWAACALGRLKHCAESAIPVLVSLVERHPMFGVRQVTVAALSKIDPTDLAVRGCILRALNDPIPFVRREALQAVIAFGTITASQMSTIEQMRSDPDEAVSWWSEITCRNLRLNEGGTFPL